MDDRATETHFLTRLGVCVQRVVVTVQPVEMCGFKRSLDDTGCIGSAAGWGREARDLGSYLMVKTRMCAGKLVRLTFGSSPSSLSDIESTANGSGVCLSSLGINETLFCLDDGTRLALVVNAENFAPDLELPALAGYG